MPARLEGWRALALWLVLIIVQGVWAEEKLGSLTIDGNTFSNVTIITRTGTHISFEHAGGFASVKLAALPASAQTKVGYRPPAPPKTMTERLKELTAWVHDPRLHALGQEIWQESRAEAERVLAENDRLIINSILGGAICIYLLFCLAAVKICRKTTVRPGLWVWLPGFQWVSLLKAAGMPSWYFFLLLIPPINLLVMIIWCFKICRMRQKSSTLGFLLLVPVINIFVYFYLALSEHKGAQPLGRRDRGKVRLSF